MTINLNEIRNRAFEFAREFKDEKSESGEAKTFWDEFFKVFGVPRRRVAAFEVPVKKANDAGGFIDLLWKGKLLVEHKSRGRDLDKAKSQATDYFEGLKDADLPRYVIVSDFARFRLYDLEENNAYEFHLEDLHKNIGLFGFISGHLSHPPRPEDPINNKAVVDLGKLHDLLKGSGYDGHNLEVLLVRMLFCMFAEDTGIFEIQQFQDYIEQRTNEDGSDLGMHLNQLSQVLNTEPGKRQKNLDEEEAAFPYVNGQLFSEVLPNASFDAKMRKMLLQCCSLDWSRISPAIFGSLFQSVMSDEERRNLGAHYTTEVNILKALGPLLLDSLWTELKKIGRNKNRLTAFHEKLASIKILDPACGCGNFLVVAYRELRELELEVLLQLQKGQRNVQLKLDSKEFALLVDVDQFYGIELDEFPAQIGQVALWLTDHQMNLKASQIFGESYARIPLVKTPHIVHGNALELDWEKIIAPEELTCIVGNPPFGGKKRLTPEQVAERNTVFAGVPNSGVLDYVACWYLKSVWVMKKNPDVRTALVSTNSITQGEQVGGLWSVLLQMGVKIHFAHRTFQWSSEARGKAAVHCVIIGFGLDEVGEKWIVEYETPIGVAHKVKARNINPYLVDAPSVLIENRNSPLSPVPQMGFGNMPNDGGNFLLSDDEKHELLISEPRVEPFLKRFMSAKEFIGAIPRWCLWLHEKSPSAFRKIPAIRRRINSVKNHRKSSSRKATQNLANTPYLFGEIRQPNSDYVLIPRHSSENRQYIPMGFFGPNVIVADSCLFLPDASLFHFGVLTSAMHMAWVRAVGGRLESRYRYSIRIVYNNFPWPDPTEKKIQAVEYAAQTVLDVREKFPDSTLADLYDPLTMPAALLKAHKRVDTAVDAAYGRRKFESEAARVVFLFEKYEEAVGKLEK